MIDEDKREFAQLLQGVQTEVYQRPELTVQALRVWWMALGHLRMGDFRAALSAHVRSEKFPPTPADILRLAEGSSEDKARSAWYMVRSAIGRAGQYASVAFDDPAIHCAIRDIGGWPRLCQTPEAELPFRERDFIAAYQIHAARKSPHPSHLPGVHEIDNAASGFGKAPRLTLIGDVAKASEVVRTGSDSAARLPMLEVKDTIPLLTKEEVK